MGALLPSVPEAYGGLGATFAYDAAVLEDIESVVPEVTTGVSGAQRASSRTTCWTTAPRSRSSAGCPSMASGELVGAIAMTEPGTGSDLQGVKTTRACATATTTSSTARRPSSPTASTPTWSSWSRKTDPSRGAKGISLIVVETDGDAASSAAATSTRSACTRQDTSELFFDDVRVPPANLLGGEEGKGFVQLMQQLPQERLSIAVGAVGSMERALELTVDYAKERQAFGKPIIEFQNTAFKLAELQDRGARSRASSSTDCIERHRRRRARRRSPRRWPSGGAPSSRCEVVDECLQLHGGYGYMKEYPIARMCVDARVQKIYGGTNEIMKELIGTLVVSGARSRKSSQLYSSERKPVFRYTQRRKALETDRFWRKAEAPNHRDLQATVGEIVRNGKNPSTSELNRNRVVLQQLGCSAIRCAGKWVGCNSCDTGT